MVEGDDVADLRETFPLGNYASGVTPVCRLGVAANATVLVCWAMRHEMLVDVASSCHLDFVSKGSRATSLVVICLASVGPMCV